MLKSEHHVVELQSLRGFAALVVVLSHCFDVYAVPLWTARAASILNAQAAVVIFFVLSGCVLTQSLLRSGVQLGNVLRFYARRLFRLYPAIWAASAIGFLFLFFFEPIPPLPEVTQWFYGRWVANGYSLGSRFILSSAGVSWHLVPPLWTILVELVGSALIPIAAFMLFYSRRMFWTATILLGTASFSVGVHTHQAILMYQIDFFLGAAVFAVPESVKRLCNRHSLLLLAFSLVVLASTRVLNPSDHNDPLMHAIEVGAAWIAVLALVHAESKPYILSRKASSWLGDISYSLYLVHFVTISFLVVLLGRYSSIHNVLLLNVALICSSLLVSLPLSALLHRFVEVPGIELGRRVSAVFHPSAAALRAAQA